MGGLSTGQTIWLTRAQGERPLGRAAGGRRGALLRGMGLAGLAGLVGALALTSLPPPDLAAAAPAPVAAAKAPKSPTRLAAWNGPLPPAPASALAPALAAAPAPGLFEPRPDAGSPARFEPGVGPRPAALAFAPSAKPAPVAEARPDGWRESEHARVAALDGRTLDAGDIRIVLAGIGLPDPGQMCRTLDGRFEPCAERAKTQLELLTRARTLVCRTRAAGPGLAEGHCRIGAGDLAERLLRTGFVHRSGDEGRTVAFVDTSER